MSDFFSKPGTLLWTRTLGTIISCFRGSAGASRGRGLHGRARWLRVALLSLACGGELRCHSLMMAWVFAGASVAGCWGSVVNLFHGMISPDYTFSIFKSADSLQL